MLVGSLGGLAAAVLIFAWPASGTYGTWGALGVIISSLLIVPVALCMAIGRLRAGWPRVVLDMLLLLEILATGFCAWLLEANAMVVLTGVALLGWFLHVFIRPGSGREAGQLRSRAA
jgi:hypothetical protein